MIHHRYLHKVSPGTAAENQNLVCTYWGLSAPRTRDSFTWTSLKQNRRTWWNRRNQQSFQIKVRILRINTLQGKICHTFKKHLYSFINTEGFAVHPSKLKNGGKILKKRWHSQRWGNFSQCPPISVLGKGKEFQDFWPNVALFPPLTPLTTSFFPTAAMLSWDPCLPTKEAAAAAENHYLDRFALVLSHPCAFQNFINTVAQNPFSYKKQASILFWCHIKHTWVVIPKWTGAVCTWWKFHF